MTGSMTLNNLLKVVRDQFQDGPPNGWLLGWDEMRYFKLISSAAEPHVTINQTSFDYGFCNWFDVHIEPGGDERCWLLTIKLSFIAPTYCMFWTQYEGPTHGTVIATAPDGYQPIEDKVRALVHNKGFFELPDEWYDKQVEGVFLELSESGNVTLSKCLFTDYS